MAIVDRLIGLGCAPELAKEISAPTGDFDVTGEISATTALAGNTLRLGAAAAVTAAGATAATATELTVAVNNVTTVAASTGVRFSDLGMFVVRNAGANDLLVYPPTGGTLNGAAVDAGVTLAAASDGMLIAFRLSTLTYIAIEAASAA